MFVSEEPSSSVIHAVYPPEFWHFTITTPGKFTTHGLFWNTMFRMACGDETLLLNLPFTHVTCARTHTSICLIDKTDGNV